MMVSLQSSLPVIRKSSLFVHLPIGQMDEGGWELGRERERCSRERQTNRLMSTYRSSDDCRPTKGPLRGLNRYSKSLKFPSLSRKRCGEPSLGGTRAIEKIVQDYSSCGSLISFSANPFIGTTANYRAEQNRNRREKEESRMVYGANVLSSAKVGGGIPPLSPSHSSPYSAAGPNSIWRRN